MSLPGQHRLVDGNGRAETNMTFKILVRCRASLSLGSMKYASKNTWIVHCHTIFLGDIGKEIALYVGCCCLTSVARVSAGGSAGDAVCGLGPAAAGPGRRQLPAQRPGRTPLSRHLQRRIPVGGRRIPVYRRGPFRYLGKLCGGPSYSKTLGSLEKVTTEHSLCPLQTSSPSINIICNPGLVDVVRRV